MNQKQLYNINPSGASAFTYANEEHLPFKITLFLLAFRKKFCNIHFPSRCCFCTHKQKLFVYFSSIYFLGTCYQYRTYEHDMMCPCFRQINGSDEIKWEHEESCSLTNENITSSLSRCLWPQKVTVCRLTMEASTDKVRWPFDHVVLRDYETNLNHLISTTTMPMATKLEGIVTCLKGLLLIKLPNSLFRWSYKITYQTETIVYTLPRCPWPPNLAQWLLTMSFCPKKGPSYQPFSL